MERTQKLLLNFLLLCLCVVGVRCSTKCYKDHSLGDVEENVYYCYDDKKPECCQQNDQFTCCETNNDKNVREQLQLWGTVAAFILVLGILFLCCKNDYSLCSDDKPVMQRLGIGRKPPPPLTDISQSRQRENTLDSLGRQFADTPVDPPPYYDRFPPLPPATPYTEKVGGGGRNSVYPALDTPSPLRGRNNDAFVDDDKEYLYRK